MKRNILILLSTFLASWLFQTSVFAQGPTCQTATPFCDNVLNPFPAGTNQPPAPAGNNYDCLFSQPNPAWYTMTVGIPGTLDFTLMNTNNVDVDFIVWGPFANLADAFAACGNLGNGGTTGNVVDCSYSGSAIEQVVIPNAQVGDVYMFLITNFSNQPTDIYSTANVGNGAIVCDCKINNSYSLLPTPAFNQGLMLDTSGYEATFIVCGPDPLSGATSSLGFMLSAGGENTSDSLSFYAPGSDINVVFPGSAVFISPASTPPFYDSLDVIATLSPNTTHAGPHQFNLAILNSGANACIQNFPITVIVPNVEATASDTLLCPFTADTVQLFSETFIDTTLSVSNSEFFTWSQLSGPAVTLSGLHARNPFVYIPNNLQFGEVMEFVVDYHINIDTANGQVCGGRDTVRMRVGGGILTVGAGDTICVGEQVILTAHYETFMQGGAGTCGASTLSCGGASTQYTFGTGGGTTGFGGGHTPFYGFYEDSRLQILFLASELTAMGIQPGLLSSMSFNVATLGSSQPYSNFTIKIGCTNLTSMPGGAFPAVATATVYTNTVTPVMGWNNFPFQTNYEWDGVSNVLVDVCFDNNSWTGNDEVFFTNTPFQSMQYDYMDGMAGCSMTGMSGISGTGFERPDVRFTNCQLAPPITYTWSPTAGIPGGQQNQDTVIATPSNNTLYIMSATDGYCTLRDTVPVLVQSALGAPAINCDSVGLDFINFSWDALGGAVSYEYSLDGGTTWIPLLGTAVSITGLAEGENVDIMVRGVTGAANCNYGVPGSQSCQTLTCSFQFNLTTFNNTACNGEPANGFIVANVTGGNPPFTFELNGNIVTITSTTDTIFTGLSAISDAVIGTEDNTTCSGTANFNVQDQSVSVGVAIQQTQNVPCTGEAVAALVATTSGTPNSTLQWSTGETTATIGNLGGGIYTVIASIGACADTATYEVLVPFNPSLNATINGLDSTSIFLGETVDLNGVNGQAGVTYLWTVDPAAPIADPGNNITTSTPTTVGFYTYIITATADTCVVTDTVWLTVNETGFKGMPSAFTPNGDGQNDVFKPVDLIGAEISAFQVFNRWGHKVYDGTNNSNAGWDGNLGTQPQARDVYMFVLEYQFPGDAEPTVLRGEVTLLR